MRTETGEILFNWYWQAKTLEEFNKRIKDIGTIADRVYARKLYKINKKGETMKHTIFPDLKLNPELREIVSEVRGGILSQTLKKVTKKYSITYCSNAPKAVISYKGKSLKVGLCDLPGALDALNTFL